MDRQRKYIVTVDEVKSEFFDIFGAIEYARKQTATRKVVINYLEYYQNQLQYDLEIFNNRE